MNERTHLPNDAVNSGGDNPLELQDLALRAAYGELTATELKQFEAAKGSNDSIQTLYREYEALRKLAQPDPVSGKGLRLTAPRSETVNAVLNAAKQELYTQPRRSLATEKPSGIESFLNWLRELGGGYAWRGWASAATCAVMAVLIFQISYTPIETEPATDTYFDEYATIYGPLDYEIAAIMEDVDLLEAESEILIEEDLGLS